MQRVTIYLTDGNWVKGLLLKLDSLGIKIRINNATCYEEDVFYPMHVVASVKYK